MRRALTTVQMCLDHRGNLIAASRSTAKATITLEETIDELEWSVLGDVFFTYQELIE